MMQATISRQEIEQRLADIDRRIQDTQELLLLKQGTNDALESLTIPPGKMHIDPCVLRNCVSVLRIALLAETAAGIKNLETLLAELQAAQGQLRALKFGVIA